MKWGTCHFVSEAAALRYYAPYHDGPAHNRHEVKLKLAEGLIAIGKPQAKPGERVFVDRDGRYWIDDGV